MAKKIIVVGDGASHGGKVKTASPERKIDGKSISRLGDLVDCPQKYPKKRPRGINKIIEGSSSYLTDAIPVALEGHHTECGFILIKSMSATVG
ncbi:MAG: PAAR domain-containing protein [Proteobacteria bacterium]|nr:MAG: PAAR domain-containing protein [Pseudomonadota bacterium]